MYNFATLSGTDPWVTRIRGQFHHNVYALNLNKNESPKYGQLYVLDNDIATAERKNITS